MPHIFKYLVFPLLLADMWKYCGQLVAQIWQTGAGHPSANYSRPYVASVKVSYVLDMRWIWVNFIVLLGSASVTVKGIMMNQVHTLVVNT